MRFKTKYVFTHKFLFRIPYIRRITYDYPCIRGNLKFVAQNISFDDLFMQRRFSSYIYGESNVYENRFIIDYLVGDDILYESEKIKTSLMEMEHDLWEF